MLQVARFGLSTVIRGNCASKRLSRLSVIRPVAGSACSLRSLRDQARPTKRSVSLVLHNREPRGVQHGGFCQRVKSSSASDQLLQLPGLALRSVGAANTATSSEPERPTQSRWRSLITWILRLLTGAVVLGATLLACLPSFLSTPRGRNSALAVANQFVPGTVQVADLHVGWQQPIDISGISWTEPQELGGRQLASVDRINTSQSLWHIARGRPFDAVVSQPFVDCSIDARSGEMHINQVLQGTALPVESVTEPSTTTGIKERGKASPKRQLLVESSPLRFSAEGHLANGHLYCTSGVLQVPDELRQVVGDQFHVSAIVGAANLKSEAETYGMDPDWAVEDERPDDKQQAGTLLDPTAVFINSEHVQAQLSGWRTKAGMLLKEPATVSVDYTPALAKYGLQRISPLLSNVVAVQEGGQVQMTWKPKDMVLPAEKSTLRIEPMKLVVGKGHFASRIIDLLRLKDRSWAGSNLRAWTSTIAVDVHPEGLIHTQRLDILLGTGHGHKGMHLCMWGSVDPTTDSALDMTLGFPSDTLTMAGLTGVPQNGMFTLKITGTAENPKVDWSRAYNKLTSAALAWQSQAPDSDEPVSVQQALVNKGLQGLNKLHHKVTTPKKDVGEGEKANPVTIPTPVADLPWETESSVVDNSAHDL